MRYRSILSFCFAALAWMALAAPPAHAQQVTRICIPITNVLGAQSCQDVTSLNPLPVTASVSLSGFAPASVGTPISVTTGGVTGTLPAGTVVIATNVGTTNGAYCALGASSTTSQQYIAPNGGWFAFTVGAATQLTCITSTSTTTVNMVGGSGLATGTGGGGGGSGGGGAITAASGSYAAGALSAGAGVDGWDLTQGAKADAAWVSGSGSVVAILKAIAGGVAAPIPAGTFVIGKTTTDQTTPGTTDLVHAAEQGTWTVQPGNTPNTSPWLANPTTQYPSGATPITASATGTTGATTATLAASASIKTYICGFSIRANATAAATADSTVTGTVTGTLHYTQWTAPAASGIGLTEQVFMPCIPSSAINTGVAVISAAPGTGGVVSVSAWGYQL